MLLMLKEEGQNLRVVLSCGIVVVSFAVSDKVKLHPKL